ncbi:hypothetical protein AKO1_012045 [Acrasis kona]|uniref:COMM domain-containing protein n=1 Tax=Acrasis kona TaxID=1008807 RepID=A0AAW2Z9G5_9EUKA
MSILNATPSGFHSAVDSLNKIPIEIVSEMVSIGAGCYVEDYVEKFAQLGVDHSFDIIEDALQNVINVLLYIFRVALKSKAEPQILAKSLRADTQMSVPHIQTLYAAYDKFFNENSQDLNDASTSAFKNESILPRVTDVSWKLAVCIASDACEDLSSGKVTLCFKLDNHKQQTLELTCEEFKNLHSQFQEMASLINTLQ